MIENALRVCLCCVLAGPLLLGGCENGSPMRATTQPAVRKVEPPLGLLLPREIRIHPFTGTRTFDEAGGVRGVDVRIEAVDAYGDTGKAFGEFRFELFTYMANSENNRGQLLATWDVSLMDPKANLLHWDKITRTYKFKLQWDQPIPVGQRFVLAAVLSSPYTERLFAQRTFISGQ